MATPQFQYDFVFASVYDIIFVDIFFFSCSGELLKYIMTQQDIFFIEFITFGSAFLTF